MRWLISLGLALTLTASAQDVLHEELHEPLPNQVILDPINDPFQTNNRVNLFYTYVSSATGETTSSFTLNPVLSLNQDTALQLSMPYTLYNPGSTGNAVAQGASDFSALLINRFAGDESTAHAWGVRVTFDTARYENVGGGATVLQPLYAFAWKPDDERKLIALVNYQHSVGTTYGDPTRKAVLRLQGYQYLGPAYLGIELRQEFDLFKKRYSPFAAFNVGGAVNEDLQIWGQVRLPLNNTSFDNTEIYEYTLGITLPF